jgi:hypothetical protein
MFGFSVVLMASWEIVLATASLGLLNGGTAGFLYTNLASWIGFTCAYAVGMKKKCCVVWDMC